MQHCSRIAPEREIWAGLEDSYVAFCSHGKVPELDLEEKLVLRSLMSQSE